MKRVKRNLVGYFFRVIKTGEPFAGEVAISAFVPLHRYQAGRQATAKEFLVEEIIGSSQAGVCLRCRIVHISVLTLYILYRTIQFYYFPGGIVKLYCELVL